MRDDWLTGGGECGVESGLGDPSVTGVESQAGARAQPVQLRRAKVLACRLSAGQTLLDRGRQPRPVGQAAARRRRAA